VAARRRQEGRIQNHLYTPSGGLAPDFAEAGVCITLHEVRAALSEVREETLRGLGFHYVTLDLEGYRQGAMNEALKRERR